MRPFAALLAVGVSATLYACAFPPLGLAPLAWVALAPLLVVLARVRPLPGAGLGLLWGVAAGAGVASWLPAMISGFFGVGAATGWLAAGAVWVALAGLPVAAFGAVASGLAARRALGPGTVALAWGATELVRIHGPVENPWALLALSQSGWLPFVQGADLVGVVGLGMLVAAGNAVLAGLLDTRLRVPRFRIEAACSAALLAAALGYGELRLAQTFGQGPSVRVALVQAAVAPERRFQAEHRAENLARHLALAREALAQAPALVLWPELAVDFELATEPVLYQALTGFTRTSDTELLFGAPHHRYRHLVREALNSAFLLRDGRIVGRHDKVRLMPFSERRPRGVPLGRDAYRPGLALRPLPSRIGGLGVLLCSEAMDATHVRRLVAAGAAVLANPSNDDWFRSRGAAEHQLAAAIFRAVENRRFVLRPSTSGASAVVDPHGRVVARAPYREPAVIVARVWASEARTVYQRLVDRPVQSASVFLLVSTLHLAVSRRRIS